MPRLTSLRVDRPRGVSTGKVDSLDQTRHLPPVLTSTVKNSFDQNRQQVSPKPKNIFDQTRQNLMIYMVEAMLGEGVAPNTLSPGVKATRSKRES